MHKGIIPRDLQIKYERERKAKGALVSGINELVEYVVLACAGLQGNHMYFDASENDRNTYLRDMLGAFGYDTQGLPLLFLVSYVKTARFGEFCERYVAYAQEMSYPFERVGKMHELPTMHAGTDLRVFETEHLRNGREVRMAHVLVCFPPG